MTKHKLYVVFSTLLLCVTILCTAYVSSVLAQEATPIPTGGAADTSNLKPSYNMECISAMGPPRRGGKNNEDEGVSEPPIEARVNFNGKCSSPNPCRLVVCGGTSSGRSRKMTFTRPYCTTRDPVLDEKYFGESGLGHGLPGTYVLDGQNEILTFKPGDIVNVPGIIHNPDDHIAYGIYALSEVGGGDLGVANVIVDNENEANIGDNATLQQGTIQFYTPQGTTAPVAPVGQQKKCISAFWDPYGRVFDAISLEPLGEDEARVTLFNKDGSYVNVPSNNSPIDNIGKYNILIQEDGMYTLKVDSMSQHEFVKINPDPRYVDLYESLYIAGDPAFEEKKESPRRMDIPVKPKGTPYTRDVEWVYKNQNIIVEDGVEYTKIDFRVSHPLTIVKTNMRDSICQQTDGNTVDKEGFCTMVIDNATILLDLNASAVGISINLIKNPKYYPFAPTSSMNFVDRTLALFSKNTYAQGTKSNTVVYFEPLLRHIQGYAVDARGQVIPNAQVEVRYSNNDKIHYTTTANNLGFFVIYKSNLPPLEYYINYVDPKTNKAITKTTSSFVKENSTYLKSATVDLMKPVSQSKKIISNVPYSPRKDIITSAPAENLQTSSPYNFQLVLTGILLVVFCIGAIGIALHIKSKPSI